MPHANYKRDSYNGFGNGLARAFELTATPALFGLIGHFVDGWANTTPWFTIGLVVFAIIGMFIKLWFGYDHEMKSHEAKIGRPVLVGIPTIPTSSTITTSPTVTTVAETAAP